MDINTQVIDMDVLVGEQVVKNKDDSYTIFLNARLSYERQLSAYWHAINHIKNGDFDKGNADIIEQKAHRQ